MVARAAALDREAEGEAEPAAAAAAHAAAATLRRLVFNLLSLVDHPLVPDVQAAAEAAVMSAGSSPGRSSAGRMAAYEDLVSGVLACGDYARKSACVEWALRLRSRM